MRLQIKANGISVLNSALAFITFGITLALLAPCAVAQTQSANSDSAETKPAPDTYQTFYLVNATQQNDINEVLTALRSVLPKAKVLAIESQNAISFKGSPDEIALAQKIITDLDRPKKLYRLTYTISEIDGGKRTVAQHYSLILLSREKVVLRQGNRVPVITGTYDQIPQTAVSQFQYMDVGLSFESTLEGYADGVALRYRVEQSSLAEEKSGTGPQNPALHQTVLDGWSTLLLGKPQVLGSLDIPDSTRKQEIEVVAELVR
jgi:type II secretory pathway component GspD/PulD (secretin)